MPQTTEGLMYFFQLHELKQYHFYPQILPYTEGTQPYCQLQEMCSVCFPAQWAEVYWKTSAWPCLFSSPSHSLKLDLLSANSPLGQGSMGCMWAWALNEKVNCMWWKRLCLFVFSFFFSNLRDRWSLVFYSQVHFSLFYSHRIKKKKVSYKVSYSCWLCRLAQVEEGSSVLFCSILLMGGLPLHNPGINLSSTVHFWNSGGGTLMALATIFGQWHVTTRFYWCLRENMFVTL